MANDDASLALPTAFLDDRAGDEDQLGRHVFAERIADVLATHPGDASLVVGIHGPWGSGKSTVLQYVADAVRKDFPDSIVKLVEFNPWFYATEEEIIMDFFTVVGNAIGTNFDGWYYEAGKRLGLLSRIVAAVSSLWAPLDIASGLLKILGEMLAKDKTLRQRHDLLKEALEDELVVKKDIRIIVAIDDLDRVDADAIFTIFRLVKLAAGLPRISYLLAFDRVQVSAALHKRYMDDGTGSVSFLEKIIQVPLDLPRADHSLLATLLLPQLFDVLQSHGIRLSAVEQYELQLRLDEVVWPAVPTLRAGKRLVNAINFAAPIMHGQVHVGDQVLIEALRLLYPSVYEFVRSHKDLVLTNSENLKEVDANWGKMASAFKNMTDDQQDSCTQLLGFLFPGLLSRPYADRAKVMSEKRACARDFFDRYFSYGLPIGDISDSEIDAVVAAKREESAVALHALLEEHDPALVVQKVINASHRLEADQAVSLAQVVASQAAALPGYDTPLRPEVPVSRGALLVCDLVRRAQPELRTPSMRRVFEGAEDRFAVLIFRWMQVASRADSSHLPVYSPSEVAATGEFLAGRLMTPYKILWFYTDMPDVADVVARICRQYGGPQFPDVLHDVLNESSDALVQFLHVHMPASATNQPSSPFSLAAYESISTLISPQALMDLLTHHFPNLVGPFDSKTESGRRSIERATREHSSENLVFRFAEIHRLHEGVAPLAPPSVYQLSAQRSSPLNNHHPRSIVQGNEDAPDLVVRVIALVPDCIGLPTGLTGATAAQFYGDSRERLLKGQLAAADFTTWLISRLNVDEEQRSDLWQLAGMNAGEVSTLRVDSIGSGDESMAMRFAGMECYVSTGMVQANRQGITTSVPGMLMQLDARLYIREREMLAPIELARLVIAMLNIVDVADRVGTAMVGNGDYSAGELAVMIATGHEAFDEVLDIAQYPSITGNTRQREAEVYSSLPIQSIYPDDFQAQFESPNERRERIALEVIHQVLEQAGKRNYTDSLHRLRAELSDVEGEIA